MAKKAKKAKGRLFWLTRDAADGGGWYELWRKKPVWDEESGMWKYRVRVRSFCFRPWQSMTGIILEQGAIVPVRITQLKNGFTFEVVK